MTPLLLVGSVALDSATFLAIWPRELNPLVLALGLGPALLVRWIAVAVAIAAGWPRLRRGLLVAAYASAFGAATNVLTMAA